MSVCPQHNVLFDYLTVREHLELYAQFKGVGYISVRVEKILGDLELEEIQHQISSTLSGG